MSCPQVTAMLSEEGEKVPLKTTFNPKTAGGNVEKWFIEAEAAMRETVKDVTRQSFDAYAVSKRIDWVLQWPGQVCISTSVPLLLPTSSCMLSCGPQASLWLMTSDRHCRKPQLTTF